MKINISFRKFVAKSLIWLRNSAQNTISTSDIHYSNRRVRKHFRARLSFYFPQDSIFLKIVEIVPIKKLGQSDARALAKTLDGDHL